MGPRGPRRHAASQGTSPRKVTHPQRTPGRRGVGPQPIPLGDPLRGPQSKTGLPGCSVAGTAGTVRRTTTTSTTGAGGPTGGSLRGVEWKRKQKPGVTGYGCTPWRHSDDGCDGNDPPNAPAPPPPMESPDPHDVPAHPCLAQIALVCQPKVHTVCQAGCAHVTAQRANEGSRLVTLVKDT